MECHFSTNIKPIPVTAMKSRMSRLTYYFWFGGIFQFIIVDSFLFNEMLLYIVIIILIFNIVLTQVVLQVSSTYMRGKPCISVQKSLTSVFSSSCDVRERHFFFPVFKKVHLYSAFISLLALTAQKQPGACVSEMSVSELVGRRRKPLVYF